MKTIKKITLLVSMALLSCAAVFAQDDLPAFENENAYVFDASAVSGKFKDNIVIINKNDAEDLEVKLSGYKDGWEELGYTTFRFFDDDYKIDSRKNFKPSSYKYFAVELTDGVTASYKITKDHNDLIIEIRNEGSDLTKPAIPTFSINPDAFLFDLYAIDEDADENMKFKGKFATKERVGFRVYAYAATKHEWIVFGTSYIERKGDRDSVEGKNAELSEYRYYAIESMNGVEYVYEPEESDDDLIVTVTLP